MIRRYAIFVAALVAVALLLRLLIVADNVFDASGLKAFIAPVAVIYLNTFNNPATAIALSLGMILIGLAIIFYYWIARLAPAGRELKRMAHHLSSITDPPGSAKALSGVDEVLSGSRLLSRDWRLYKANLTHTATGSWAALQPPDQHFHIARLRRAGVPIESLRGIAADFVAIGLIFTFLGLVAGLYFAGRSMLSADLGAARLALIQLLHASTFKFLTSITGIGMSLVFIWAHRVLIGGLERRLDDVTALVEDKLPPLHHAETGADGFMSSRLAIASTTEDRRASIAQG